VWDRAAGTRSDARSVNTWRRGGVVAEGGDCITFSGPQAVIDAYGGKAGIDATCTDQTPAENPRGFSCQCKSGFAGDGFACRDVDECAILCYGRNSITCISGARVRWIGGLGLPKRPSGLA